MIVADTPELIETVELDIITAEPLIDAIEMLSGVTHIHNLTSGSDNKSDLLDSQQICEGGSYNED